MICIICREPFEHDPYDDNQCPNCGQQYTHDESQTIVLSEEQLRLLRNQYGMRGVTLAFKLDKDTDVNMDKLLALRGVRIDLPATAFRVQCQRINDGLLVFLNSKEYHFTAEEVRAAHISTGAQ